MSRTFRKPSHYKSMGLRHLKYVKDGTRTRPSKDCENNCGCPYCESNRLHKHNKQTDLKEEIKLSDLDDNV